MTDGLARHATFCILSGLAWAQGESFLVMQVLHVKAEVHYVAVLDDIVFSFDIHFTGFLDGSFTA